MSFGYHAPLPPFTGPDAGEVRDNRAAQVEAARKTPVGVTEYGDVVYRLDEDVQYWAVESVYDQYNRWVGTTRNEYTIPAGTLVRGENWATLRWPTRWTDFATSMEWRAGERSGPISSHQNPSACGVLWPETVCEDRIESQRLKFEAALAARWVVENVDLPERNARGRWIPEDGRTAYWYDQVCHAQFSALCGYSARDYGEFVADALRQYAQGESDKARKAREDARRAKEEEEWRMKNSPFAVLAALKSGIVEGSRKYDEVHSHPRSQDHGPRGPDR